jgi:hypothetical protein
MDVRWVVQITEGLSEGGFILYIHGYPVLNEVTSVDDLSLGFLLNVF